MGRYEEKHAALAKMGIPSGTSSTTARPCTPNGQEKGSIEVFEVRTCNATRIWTMDLDIRGPRREWTCFVQPSIQRPHSFLRCQYQPQRPHRGYRLRRLHNAM